MNDNMPITQPTPSSEEIARQWFVRLRGETTEDMRRAFETWLQADPAHAAAYKAVEQHFHLAESLKASSIYGANRPSAPFSGKASQNMHAGRIVGVVALAASLIMMVFLTIPSKIRLQSPAMTQDLTHIASRKGEIRSLRLSDGSSVILDTDSAIDIAMNRSERQIHLAKGHIRLAISNDPRPFLVEAGKGVVTTQPATPASFDLGFDDNRGVRLAMMTGHAEANPILRTANWTVSVPTLGAGQALGWPAEAFSPVRIDTATSGVDASQWPTGWVSYHAVALGELVAQANRYTNRPIILDGQTIARMAVTGRFHVSDPDRLAGNITDVFGLARSDTQQAIVLRLK